jgi:hypothetical protein
MGYTDPQAYDNRLTMMNHIGILQIMSHLGLKEYEGQVFEYPDNERFEFYISTIGRVFPAYAREAIAQMAVDGGMDYLFFIDDDMLAHPDIFEQLYKNKVDICAGLAFTRNAPHKPVIYNLDTGYSALEHKYWYENYPVMNYPKDELVECDAVGFGAVLIKVDILKQMKKPWFMVTSGAGEDIHFCHQAREKGFRVFMDTSAKLGHVGNPIVITEETYEKQDSAKKVRSKGTHNKYKKASL